MAEDKKIDLGVDLGLLDEKNAVKSSWVKFTLVGDAIVGTLVAVSERESTLPGKEGTMQKSYEILADGGSWHDLDEKKNPVKPPVKIQAGETWFVGGRLGLDPQMARIKIGQRLGIKFCEEVPSTKKGFNALKIIKAITKGEMNEAWLMAGGAAAKDLI